MRSPRKASTLIESLLAVVLICTVAIFLVVIFTTCRRWECSLQRNIDDWAAAQLFRAQLVKDLSMLGVGSTVEVPAASVTDSRIELHRPVGGGTEVTVYEIVPDRRERSRRCLRRRRAGEVPRLFPGLAPLALALDVRDFDVRRQVRIAVSVAGREPLVITGEFVAWSTP